MSGSRQRRCHRAASTLGSPKAPHTPRSRQVGWAAAESQVSQHQSHPLAPAPTSQSAFMEMGRERGLRVPVTCWLVPAAVASCRRGTRCSRRPCTGPCTWRCTSGGGEGARLSAGFPHDRRPLPRTADCARAAAPPHRPVNPRTRKGPSPGPGPRRPPTAQVSPAPNCPGSPPASRCTSGSTCPSFSAGKRETSAATPAPWRTPPPSAPAPGPARTCRSSCALATAICTFTCSMMRPGSSLPPPEPPKSEPKPPSMAPQSQPDSGRVRRPVPAPEASLLGLRGKWSPGAPGAGRRAGL